MYWLTRFLFAHTRKTAPDGRPLYAYKMREASYNPLRDLVRQILLLDPNGQQSTYFHPIFCLFAAETFRREHADGPWTWETVFKPLDGKVPSQSTIAEWVDNGLKWWRRPVLRNKGGHRLLLMTIACEGGLPLRLLHRENTHLTQFFRLLLDHYYRAGQGGESAAETIARQHADRLPRSLRQDPVFHLAATLIAKVSELQTPIGPALDPIAALNEKQPDWRDHLPLRLEDQVAETLLTGLVRRSGELAREAGARPRWRGQLRETGAGWQVEKQLEWPELISNAQLAEWTGLPIADRPRWRLLLHTPAGVETVAWLTLVQTARYRREWLHPHGVRLAGVKLTQPHRCSLHDGQRDYPLAAQQDAPWGDSPWVFVARGRTGEREWLTEGSARTRSEWAWVLAGRDLTPQILNGACEFVGILPELDRMVYRISGEVELRTPQQDGCRILCQAEQESQESFILRGDTVMALIQPRPLYRGVPQIQILDAEGRQLPVAGREQWRFVGDTGSWQVIDHTVGGRIWLRLVDAQGAERCRRQVDVAPHDFRVEIDMGTGLQAGVVRLRGLAGARVETGPETPERVTMTQPDEQARIVCPSRSGSLPPPLNLMLHWPGSEPLTVTLPWPVRGACFEQAGRPLQNDDQIPLDRLGSLQLLVQDPAGGRHFRLEGELITHNEGAINFRQRFHERLPALENGRLEMPLFPWRDRIASMLASSRDLEAQVRLLIETTQGERLAALWVTRFDARFELDRETRRVYLAEPVLARLGAGWETRLSVAMIRLWTPTASPVVLSACTESPGDWPIPDDLDAGPWWIIGRDGDWTRFRPLLWVVSAHDDAAEDGDASMIGAIREPDAERREQRLNLLLAELGENPDHPDWTPLFDYLLMAREFPPSSLDVLRNLPAHPRTLALALLKASDELFESVWSLSRQMPFLWNLLAIDHWRSAASAHFGGLQTTLAEIEAGGDIVFGLFQNFREQASARRTYWRALCDWLQEQIFPGRPLPGNSELSMARRCPAILEQQIESLELELQGRHDAEELWPQGNQLNGWLGVLDTGMKNYRYLHLEPAYRPVRCAPFMAASLSLRGVNPDEPFIHELRLLRAFDREWFDSVYAIALTLGLAHKPLEN